MYSILLKIINTFYILLIFQAIVDNTYIALKIHSGNRNTLYFLNILILLIDMQFTSRTSHSSYNNNRGSKCNAHTFNL